MTDRKTIAFDEMIRVMKPLAAKYHIKEVYIFGSYARGEADSESDIDVLAVGGENFTASDIFAFGEELRILLNKAVDAYEICEINTGTEFYDTIMKERVRVA